MRPRGIDCFEHERLLTGGNYYIPNLGDNSRSESLPVFRHRFDDVADGSVDTICCLPTWEVRDKRDSDKADRTSLSPRGVRHSVGLPHSNTSRSDPSDA